MYVFVRTPLELASVSAAIRKQVLAIDPDQPVTRIRAMNDVIATSVAPRKFNTLALGLFASVALILAAIGIYGVMAFSVAQRTQEIGIRIALGAQMKDVLRMVVKQGMTLAIVGIAIGVIVAIAVTRLMKSLLYGVTATDPTTFAIIALLLSGVALLACYLPARRAARVDPMIALRCE
jgi:putative ABC transport system permease protein